MHLVDIMEVITEMKTKNDNKIMERTRPRLSLISGVLGARRS
jgi:hypothetical protein